MISKFSLSAPKEMYREECGEYTYWCCGVKDYICYAVFSFLERQCGEMLQNWKGMYVNYVNSCFTLIYIIKHGMYSMQDYTLFDNQRENKGSLRWHKFGLLMVQFSIWTLEKNLAWISLVLSLSVLNFSILNSLCTLMDYTLFFGVLFYLSKQWPVSYFSLQYHALNHTFRSWE